MRLRFLLLVILAASRVAGQDLSSFEKILLPVDVTTLVPGSGDSQFQTLFTVFSERPFDYYPCTNLVRPGPITVCTYVAPQASLMVPTYGSRGYGRIVYVSPEAAGNLAIGYLLMSIAPEDACQRVAQTQLPVVHEREFRKGRLFLLQVPVAPGVRNTLRIYDVDSKGGQAFNVRITLDPGRTVPDLEATFTTARAFELTDPLMASTFPPYAEINLQDALNGLCVPRVDPCTASRLVRIEVEAVDPTTRFWAFVTATSNTNHHVTAITPL